MPSPKGKTGICPVCGELGRLYAFGEKVVDTGAGGVTWVLGEALCIGCLSVVVEAAKDGSLPALDGGLDGS